MTVGSSLLVFKVFALRVFATENFGYHIALCAQIFDTTCVTNMTNTLCMGSPLTLVNVSNIMNGNGAIGH